MYNSRWKVRAGAHLGRVVEVTGVDVGGQTVTLQLVNEAGELEGALYTNTLFGHLMTTELVKPGPHGPYIAQDLAKGDAG